MPQQAYTVPWWESLAVKRTAQLGDLDHLITCQKNIKLNPKPKMVPLQTDLPGINIAA
jgi:hypothetical protein